MTERTRSGLLLGLALVALNVSVTFLNWWPTPLVRWTGQLSVELAVLVLSLALTHLRGRGPSILALRLLTIVWLLLVMGRYAFVTAPALWGRELNFYWDLRFLPDVFSMLAKAASWKIDALVVAAIILAGGASYVSVRWAIGTLNRAFLLPARRRALASGAGIALVLFALQRTWLAADGIQPFAAPVVASYASQAKSVVRALRGSITLAASPSFESDLSRLGGADVLLFFIESYGAVTFERPEFNAQTSARRALLDAAIRDSGNDVVSAFVTSPTFGGSSWFAHISLLSGLTIGDPDMNARLMTEHRDTLPSAMARRGYRSVAMMPGLWSPWPDGAFYGFSEIYTGPRLEYLGPPFGWWDMPDQFTLGRLDVLERDKPMRRPLFVFYPTISTHTPFSPVAPFQPDWPRLQTDHPFDDADLERIYDQPIDWTNLGPSYANAINYIYQSLAGYLAKHKGEPFVMIMLGDHQPPALVSGEGAPWDVPVHIITNNTEVLARLKTNGFKAGLTPARPTLGPMSGLLPVLMDAFGEPQRVNAN
ncbi:MAG: sulfatase-like hydrolase/transferase [Vicinamibacterales bacterium]